ncbi:hypothetical protein [Hymenobacter rubripertinctus]|uniref:hypothetical protein n=1 Tax=Hymenobacter rubripertinctus TaxID=2029981 RepID=UPI0011C3EEFB|nr:hypothetical protein [Hymenobacter rubripertinctus]
MPTYFARVVLHRTDSSDDYTDLHTEMDVIGFKRSIIGSNKKSYRLPSGMYYFDSSRSGDLYTTANAAHDAAATAVAKVMRDEKLYVKNANKPPTILVITVDESVWTGLNPEPIKLAPRPIG